MYSITFYSFKGGVGRTMAMVNVGLALAKAGRRVLFVDFDLEAPGLDTFDILKPSEPARGLVDFVTQYRDTRTSPDVRDFVYSPSDSRLNDLVWVMPAGGARPGYGERLRSIDWQLLYSEQSGYLLFEDLKQQWQTELAPEYVLIDSRTGHTDVGGICTRQLPDAVCLLFFPNEQNRRGMEAVIRDIKQEVSDTGRPIDTFFVASNVPDLDDEDSILSLRLDEFRTTFERNLDAVIHHYDSLALLQQSVFTIERPRTKLAREYKNLEHAVTSKNLDDRNVAARFLDGLMSGVPRHLSPNEIEDRLDRIRKTYEADGAMLYSLSQAYLRLGRAKVAERLRGTAADLGFLSIEKFTDEIKAKYELKDSESARSLIGRAMKLPDPEMFTINPLLRLVIENDEGFLPEVLKAITAKNLGPTELEYIAERACITRAAASAIVNFIVPAVQSRQPSARSQLAIFLIGSGQFRQARESILAGGKAITELSKQDVFNLAMAEWAESGRVPAALFKRVVEIDSGEVSRAKSANHLQCLAIASWGAGESEVAKRLVAQCRSEVDGSGEHFSAWRYLTVNGIEFVRDLDSIDAMISSDELRPEILKLSAELRN